jgi:hypothetical protein
MGDFREKEVTLVGYLAGLLSVASDVLDGGWIDDVDSCGFGFGGHLAAGEHRDANRLAPSGGQPNLLLDSVSGILQVDVPEGECDLDGLDELALWRVIERLLNRCLNVFLHFPTSAVNEETLSRNP